MDNNIRIDDTQADEGTRYYQHTQNGAQVIVMLHDNRRVGVDGELAGPGISVGWTSGSSRTVEAAREVARMIVEACDYAEAQGALKVTA